MSDIKPELLRCEYLIDPLGIDVVKPRFSWILKSDKRNQIQTAYRVLVANNKESLEENKGDLWDSQKVVSDQTNHIIYDGMHLKSEMICYWKVMVWDKEDNPSEWSKASMWTMGLLDKSDWKAKWIGAQHKEEKARKIEVRAA